MSGQNHAQSARVPEICVHVHRDALPVDREARRVVLRDYFPDRTVKTKADGSKVKLTVKPFPSRSYYVDQRLHTGLRWWAQRTGESDRRSLPVSQICGARTTIDGVGLSLSDAWSIAHWSRWWADQSTPPTEVIVLHVDDHRDLMSPRLTLEQPGVFRDMLTGKTVTLSEPPTVDAAVLSGSIGMGSFLTPLLASGLVVHLRHLQAPGRHRLAHGRYTLRLGVFEDDLLEPGAERPKIEYVRRDRRTRKTSTYEVTDDLNDWVANLPTGVPVLLHIDLDYFNNRYDGDSDWQKFPRGHDVDQKAAVARAHSLTAALRKFDTIASATISTSPGFCPAELWGPLTESLLDDLASRKSFGEALRSNVHLVPGKKRTDRMLWHVYEGEKRAGKVEVKKSCTPGLGEHQSIDVRLNQHSRGQGIGSIVFRLAAQASGYPEVYAHASKSNVASLRAAANAGYEAVDQPAGGQSLMVWRRSSPTSTRRP